MCKYLENFLKIEHRVSLITWEFPKNLSLGDVLAPQWSWYLFLFLQQIQCLSKLLHYSHHKSTWSSSQLTIKATSRLSEIHLPSLVVVAPSAPFACHSRSISITVVVGVSPPCEIRKMKPSLQFRSQSSTKWQEQDFRSTEGLSTT